jgi:hypothetical protein
MQKKHYNRRFFGKNLAKQFMKYFSKKKLQNQMTLEF